MKLPRRQFLHLAAGAAALPAVSRIAWSQSYPTRPVRIIVGAPPGGGHDIAARLIGQWLSGRLAQSFIIDNRPGANTNIGAQAAANAIPDGYTLLLLGSAHTVNVGFYGKLAVDLTRDIVPVAALSSTSMAMLIHPSVPIKTIPEFIAYAKANPGKLNMASGGNGSPEHLAGDRPSAFRPRVSGTLRLRSDATGARAVSLIMAIGRSCAWERAGGEFTAFPGAVSRAAAWVTLPTIAWPPSLTDTCCTVTFCSPPVR
jgi:hypothetical protein